jgi:Cu-processing system permease protein
MKPVLAIAITEIRLGIRSSWVLLATAILALFSILLVVLGSGSSDQVDAHLISITVASLATLSVYLIPLIALLLSFDAIAGEIDRGTLQLVLATQVARWQVLAGKFLGHLAVLTIAIVAGYGFAGLLAIQLGGLDGWQNAAAELALLTVTSLLLGAVFLAIGYLASASVRQTGTAAALAVGIWLFAVVLYDLALLGGLLVSVDGFFVKSAFPWLLVSNPADAFRVFNMRVVDASMMQTGLGGGGLPEILQGPAVLLSPIAWVFGALGLSVLALKRIKP